MEEDIYALITPEACVERRITAGGPGRDRMQEAIAVYKQKLGME